MADFAPKTVQLRNGKTVVLRSCRGSDAEQARPFLDKIGEESINTLQYPGRVINIEDVRRRYEAGLKDPAFVYLGAFDEDRIVGQIFFYREWNEHPWVRDNGRFAMFALKEFWGTGLAQELLNSAIGVMESWELRRIEATVRTGNERGIRFYQNFGFAIEGTRRRCTEINGQVHDEYYIGKTLR